MVPPGAHNEGIFVGVGKQIGPVDGSQAWLSAASFGEQG
jgi:hypothetical protein